MTDKVVKPVNEFNIFGQGMLYSAFTNGGTLTAKNYLLALSFNHLEKLLGTLFTKINQYLEKVVSGEEKDNIFHRFIHIFSNLFSKVFELMKKIKEKIYKSEEIKFEYIEEKYLEEDEEIRCEIVSEFKDCFWQAFLKDKNLIYEVSNECSLKQNEKSSFMITENWYDITLKNEDWNLYILNPYKFNFNLGESGKQLLQVSENSNIKIVDTSSFFLKNEKIKTIRLFFTKRKT